jgi:hypothetical protein
MERRGHDSRVAFFLWAPNSRSGAEPIRKFLNAAQYILCILRWNCWKIAGNSGNWTPTPDAYRSKSQIDAVVRLPRTQLAPLEATVGISDYTVICGRALTGGAANGELAASYPARRRARCDPG